MSFRVKTESIRIGSFDYRIRGLLDTNQYPSTSTADGILKEGGAIPSAQDEINPEQLYHFAGDNGTSSISPALWPLFGVVWPAGRALAEVIDGMDLEHVRMLELGCGLALAGVVAHRHGADVTVSDYHPMVPVFLEHNLVLNGLSPIQYRHIDWQAGSPFLGAYDLIVGSDILYEQGHSQELADFLMRHLTACAVVIIVDPGRRHYKKFGRLMEAEGFTTEEVRHQCFGEPAHQMRGRILTYRRSGASRPATAAVVV